VVVKMYLIQSIFLIVTDLMKDILVSSSVIVGKEETTQIIDIKSFRIA
jgi:hypothetical protein